MIFWRFEEKKLALEWDSPKRSSLNMVKVRLSRELMVFVVIKTFDWKLETPNNYDVTCLWSTASTASSLSEFLSHARTDPIYELLTAEARGSMFWPSSLRKITFSSSMTSYRPLLWVWRIESSKDGKFSLFVPGEWTDATWLDDIQGSFLNDWWWK